MRQRTSSPTTWPPPRNRCPRTGRRRTNHEPYVGCLCKKGGTAGTEAATASIGCDSAELLSLALPARSTCCGEDLSVYNHEGPLCGPVLPGKYTLHECWGISTTH